MTGPTSEGPGPPPGDPAPARIDYAPVARRRVPAGLQAALAAIGTAAVLLGIATAVPFVLGIFAGLEAVAAVAILFLFSAVRARRRTGSAGWLVGVFIGIGLALLLYGVCWMMVVKGMEH